MNPAPNFKVLKSVLVFLSSLALACGIAYGQAISGELTGAVADPTGAAVNGATVEATNNATGQKVTGTTRGQGTYRFAELPVGFYTLTVKAPGFKTTSLGSVPVDLNKANTANVRLEVGSSTETLEVSGAAEAPVDTNSAQLESLYNARLAEDSGMTSGGGASGGVLNLSMLSPGVSNANAMGLGAGPSVGGQRPRDNNFTIEGVDNNAKSVTGDLAKVPNDAVENFSLLENQFNAEFGHSSGGQFNTTIKTGTNSFHGSLYEYFRNRNMNAIDTFYSVQQGLTTNPRYDNNRYGATFGGPIIKNKLFFFTDFEREPIGSVGTSGGSIATPTQAGLTAIAADPNVNATNLQIFQKYVPLASAGTGCIQYNGQLPQADGGGNIPGGAPFSAPANGSCAAGSLEVGAVPIVAPAWTNWENYVQTLDFNVSSSDQIRGRYIMNREDLIDTAANLAPFYTVETNRFHVFTLGEYHTFTPSLINEFRFGFNRFAQNIPAGNFQFPGLDSFPNLQFNDLGALQVGPDSNAPQFTIQNLYQFVDNLSWTKGAHTIKVGAEYRWYISPQSFTQRQRGDYEYNDSQLYFEDVAPDSFGERSTGAITYYGNLKGIYWYANDVWKANRHLTLNLGVRYEYNGTSTGDNLQALNQISNDPNIIVPVLKQPLLFNKPQAPKKDFAPRVGFAYSPGDSGSTSIRGGFGMAYDILYDNIGILAVPPQVGSTADVSALTPGFLASGGLPGGGSGVTVIPDQATARASTANWIPNQIKYPYSINWNFGVQHSFGQAYTAEIRYVGTRGVHLDVQTRLNRQAVVNSQHFLPTYLQAPSQAQLDALPTTLADLQAMSSFVPTYFNDGFNGSNIVCDCPFGSSIYHGLETQLTRRFRNGLQFQAAYTYSRDIDNDTADFFSTYLTPRRPQDFQDFAAERSVSPLSRTHRFTIAAVYNMPFFNSGNWFMKNIVGNWAFAPAYTYESPEWVNVQSTNDANLNGDSAGDRTVINPSGNRDLASTVTALTNSAKGVVAYLADNPGAYYIQAGKGALANGGRDTLATVPTSNVDLAVYKDLVITERVRFRLGGQFANVLNHPQYIPGSYPGQGYGVNDVESFSSTYDADLGFVSAGSPSTFNKPRLAFPSNARTITIVGKITF
jgi:Carboxypeptidase regulatory-like domain